MFENFDMTKDIQKRFAAGIIFIISFSVLLVGASIVHNYVIGLPLVLAGVLGSIIGGVSLVVAFMEWWNE